MYGLYLYYNEIRKSRDTPLSKSCNLHYYWVLYNPIPYATLVTNTNPIIWISLVFSIFILLITNTNFNSPSLNSLNLYIFSVSVLYRHKAACGTESLIYRFWIRNSAVNVWRTMTTYYSISRSNYIYQRTELFHIWICVPFKTIFTISRRRCSLAFN